MRPALRRGDLREVCLIKKFLESGNRYSPVPKSTHYKKGAPLEYGLSVVAQTSPERSTLL